jgi:hypothetical protein
MNFVYIRVERLLYCSVTLIVVLDDLVHDIVIKFVDIDSHVILCTVVNIYNGNVITNNDIVKYSTIGTINAIVISVGSLFLVLLTPIDNELKSAGVDTCSTGPFYKYSTN